MKTKLHFFLEKILANSDVYFYTIDHLFNKIIFFLWSYILEVSTIERGNQIKQGNMLFFYIRKLDDIDNIYNFINKNNSTKNNLKVSVIIRLILKYEKIIYLLFKEENSIFLKKNFNIFKTNKKVLFILKWWWMEETIEKSFITFCSKSNISLTVLYKYWKWYWWQQINQEWFFNELKANNKNINFLYKEDFDDDYIDSIIDMNTEIFSFQYDYEGKFKNLNLIILSSVVDKKEIDCSRYKNIFSSYESRSIWYSTDKFINVQDTKIYKIFNSQNINLLNNFNILKPINKFILSWWMSWARDFSILNNLDWKYKWILISDETFQIKNFLCMYRWIQSYYWFLWVFMLSDFFIACDIKKFNNDNRSKMIATAICSWKPVIIPYHDWEIVKTVIENKLWITYELDNMDDLINKVSFFAKNNDNVKEYWERCKKYSEKNMDVNKFIPLIFDKSLH